MCGRAGSVIMPWESRRIVTTPRSSDRVSRSSAVPAQDQGDTAVGDPAGRVDPADLVDHVAQVRLGAGRSRSTAGQGKPRADPECRDRDGPGGNQPG